jgi:hypothetical protein
LIGCVAAEANHEEDRAASATARHGLRRAQRGADRRVRVVLRGDAGVISETARSTERRRRTPRASRRQRCRSGRTLLWLIRSRRCGGSPGRRVVRRCGPLGRVKPVVTGRGGVSSRP